MTTAATRTVVREAEITVPGFVTAALQRFDVPASSDSPWGVARPGIILALAPAFRAVDAQVSFGGGTPCFPVGDLFFQPGNVPLRYSGSGGKARTVGCGFEPESFERITGLKPDGSNADPAIFCDIADATLQQMMRGLARELDSPGFASEILVDSLARATLVHLSRYLRRPGAAGASRRGGLSAWQMRRIRDRLADLDQPHPALAELAELCNLSASHLSRAFKQTAGQTLYECMSAAAIRKAEHLLLDTDMALKAIAHVVGFASQATFCMAFHRVTGQPPGVYRRQFRRGSR